MLRHLDVILLACNWQEIQMDNYSMHLFLLILLLLLFIFEIPLIETPNALVQ